MRHCKPKIQRLDMHVCQRFKRRVSQFPYPKWIFEKRGINRFLHANLIRGAPARFNLVRWNQPFRMKHQRAGASSKKQANKQTMEFNRCAQLEPDYARAAYKETNGHARRSCADSQIARAVATEGSSRNIISCDRNRP